MLVFTTLALSVFTLPLGNCYRPNRSFNDHRFFIQQIFHKYGDGTFLTFEGFEHLLENLGLGQLEFRHQHEITIHKVNGTFKEIHDELGLHLHDHHHQDNNNNKRSVSDNISEELEDLVTEHDENSKVADANMFSPQSCLSPQDMLITYGLKPYHDVQITPINFIHLCPVIVYELDNRSCYRHAATNTTGGNEEGEYVWVWVYATASILTMSVAGLLLGCVIPLLRGVIYQPLIQFLMALAVGTLAGDALLHLLPHSLAFNPITDHESTTVFRSAVVFCSFLFFFIVEGILKIIRAKKSLSVKNKSKGHALQDKSIHNVEDVEEDVHVGHSHQHGGHGHGHSHGSNDTIAWIVIFGDILHNITDGLSIGAAFASSITSGLTSTIAIFCHELPHELGDYAILLRSGMSIKKSMFYNLVSSIFSFVGMAAGVLLGEIDTASLWINSFTAGSFLYIAFADLVPEMKSEQEGVSCLRNFLLQTAGVLTGGVLMLVIALYEDDLEELLQ